MAPLRNQTHRAVLPAVTTNGRLTESLRWRTSPSFGRCRRGSSSPLLVDRELAQVTEVLDIEVGSKRANELGWFAERVAEGVRRPRRDRDARSVLRRRRCRLRR